MLVQRENANILKNKLFERKTNLKSIENVLSLLQENLKNINTKTFN